jgi:hypothetical protein
VGTDGSKGSARNPGGPDEAAQVQGPVCDIALCPICTAVIAMGEMRPELVEHVLAASREFLLALRTVIDSRLRDDRPRDELHRLKIT